MADVILKRMEPILFLGALAGCVSNSSEVFETQKQLFAQGNFSGAAEVIRSQREPEPTARYFLDWVNLGSADFAAKAYEKSYVDFESAEASLKEQDAQWKDRFSSMGRDIKTSYLEGERYYQAWNCDESMVNLYKALSMLAGGDAEKARVEFNRYEVRQGRSADRAEELMKRHQVLGDNGYRTWKRRVWNWNNMVRPYRPEPKENEVSKKGKLKLGHMLENSVKRQFDPNEPPTTFEQVEALATCPGFNLVQADYKNYEPYPNCANPAGWFLCGAYRFVFGDEASDWEKGRFFFKKAAKCVTNATTAVALEILDRRANGQDMNDYVCIVYENGLGSVLERKRVEFTLNTPYPIYKGVVLPGFTARTAEGQRIEITDGAKRLGVSESICDMERMVGAEARRNFAAIADGLLWQAKIRMAEDLDALDVYQREELPKMVQQKLIRPDMVNAYFSQRCNEVMRQSQSSPPPALRTGM